MKVSGTPYKPFCPFCGQTLGRPLPPQERHPVECNIGTCECGAVYASDPTGYNIGNALVEALVHACGDWDLAWELTAEEDYLTGLVEAYDEKTHQIVETRALEGREIKGVLYFVRLQGEYGEVAQKLKARQQAPETPATVTGSDEKAPAAAMEPAPDPNRVRQRATKNGVHDMVAAGDIDGLVRLAFDDRKALQYMQRLLYTPDEAFRWKTVDAIGKTCGRLATRQPGPVSDLLHRLFAAAGDSASTSWGAIETIGAIIAGRPDIYGGFTRNLANFMGDTSTQPAALWSLGTIGRARPELLRSLPIFRIFSYLEHPDALIRGLVLRLCGNIRAIEMRERINALRDNSESIIFYDNGEAQQRTLGAMAGDVLHQLDHQGA